MNRAENRRTAQAPQRGRPWFRSLRALVVLTAGLAAPTCDLPDYPSRYWCDETHNCADVPTTVCLEEHNFCVCPDPSHVYCPAFVSCVPDAQCFPEDHPECGAGDGSVDGGGGAGGGGGDGGTGGGGGGVG
jgi:uncharacterized membrane protein YgcG